MSKIVVSLPQGLVKNSVIGGLLALASYAAMQLLWALFIDRGLLGFQQLYPLVCLSAGIASLLGCGYSVMRGRHMLSVPAVVVVFLTLTVAVSLLTANAVAVENGLVGVGLAMAAGGLLAALIGGRLPHSRGGRKKSRRKVRR